MKLDCPACGLTMQQEQRGSVKFWSCACGGHVVATSSVRKMLPEGMWGEVWPTLRAAARAGPRTCPGCGNRMETTSVLEPFGGQPLDICDSCQTLWLDPGELDAMPKRAVPKQMPLEQRQAIGRAMAAALSLEYNLRDDSTTAPIEATAEVALIALVSGLARLRLGA